LSLGHPRLDASRVKGMSTFLVATKRHGIANAVAAQANDTRGGDGSVRVWIVSGKLEG
jgi:hypothetical protein